MSWTYQIRSGRMYHETVVWGVGYSGAAGAAKNNPDMTTEKATGPIPCGDYTIGTPRDTTTHGPFVLPLTPDAANSMFGRGDFLIHGDSINAPGTASHGCIIMPPFVRRAIASSGDNRLRVVRGD